MSAVIDDAGRTVVVDLENPLVRDIVLADPQRPLGDRIRVASELVRLFRNAVCFLGLPKGIRGGAVGGLSEAVAPLRDLICVDRDGQGDRGDNRGNNASDCTN